MKLFCFEFNIKTVNTSSYPFFKNIPWNSYVCTAMYYEKCEMSTFVNIQNNFAFSVIKQNSSGEPTRERRSRLHNTFVFICPKKDILQLQKRWKALAGNWQPVCKEFETCHTFHGFQQYVSHKVSGAKYDVASSYSSQEGKLAVLVLCYELIKTTDCYPNTTFRLNSSLDVSTVDLCFRI